MRVPGYLLAGAPGIPVRLTGPSPTPLVRPRLRRHRPRPACDDARVTAFGDSSGDQHGDQHGDWRDDQPDDLPGDSSGSADRGSAGGRRTPRSSRVAAAAFLRVYEPITGASGRPNPPEQPSPAGGAEHAAALRAASALPPRVVGDLDLMSPDDDARARPALPLWPPAADGVPRACPVDLSWRATLALDEFRQSVQPELLSAFLPPEAVAHAFATFARRSRGADLFGKGRGPHIRSCAWHVPLPWLVLFAADGRQERLSGQQLCFRAAMADARRDLARALAVVRRTPTDFLPARRLEDVGRWLEEFHPRSVVELDFGGLLPIVSADEQGAGNSVALMGAALAALRAGETTQGLAGLAALRDRWAAVRAFERAN